jgi:ATP-binding cassette subfamily B multidrug efflux pump
MFRRFERLIDPFGPFSDTQMPPTTVARFAWHYLRPIRGWLVVLLAISIATGVLESSLYLLIGWFVDLLAHATPDTILAEHGHVMLAALLLILIARPLLQSLDEAVQNQIIVPQSTTMIRWRAHLYTLRHAVGYFQGDFAGRLANRITQMGPAVREIAVTLLDTLVYVAIFAVTALGLFSSISLWLALPMALWVAAYVALMWYFVPRAQARSLRNSEGRSLMVGRVVDSYTNILTVKLFARTDDERSSVREALERWMGTFLDLMRLITGVTSVLAVMNALLIAATAALSLRLWMAGAMTTGEIAGGLALVMRVVTMSGWVMHTVRGVFENIGVIQESMSTIARPHAVTDRPAAPDLVVSRGEIRFEDVTFNYGRPPAGPASGQPDHQFREDGVIEHLRLTIRPGEKVGIVGPSGAGKTTLTSLLLRLHDLEGGRILVDGQDIAAVTQDSLRRQIAVVTQDTSLLHRSIRENIAYGRLGASDQEIERAAALAHATRFVAELEDHKGRRGLDAHVGERGVKLSGGQRQRIAIARVILKDAPILVLDEATSALDSEVEAAIQEALSTLMEGKTVLAIAHRLSTIAALDRLVVMDEGRIVEEGSHGELLRRGGLYARLWHRQSGGFLGGRVAEAAE